MCLMPWLSYNSMHWENWAIWIWENVCFHYSKGNERIESENMKKMGFTKSYMYFAYVFYLLHNVSTIN